MLVTLFMVALLLGGAVLGRYLRDRQDLHDGIPPRPDVSHQPAPLARVLERAEEDARSGSIAHRRAGLEELGRLYHANGYLPEAALCWTTLHQAEPRNARWSYFLADIQRLAGAEAQMRPLLEATVRSAPEYAPAWLKLGNLNFAEQQFERAESCFHKRLELMPEDAYAAIGLARVALKQGDEEAARQWLHQSIAGTPNIPLGHNLLAGILAEEGDEEGAAEQRWLGTVAGRFREAPDPWIDRLSASCYDIERLMVLGSIDFQTAHGDRGKSYFERVIALEPDNAEPYEALGRAYLEASQPDQAHDILRRGIRLPTASPKTYVYLSEAFRRLEQPTEALRVADEGLERSPEEPDLLSARGKALSDLERYDEAIASHQAAMIDVMRSAEANLNIALIFEKMGRKNEAFVYAKQALEQRPKDPKALGVIGLLELDAQRLDSAEAYLSEFFRAYPGSTRARDLMTLLYFRKSLAAAAAGDFPSAEENALAGLEINPSAAQLNSVLGTLYAQQKRYADAIAPLERARAANPADPRTVLTLVQVYGNLRRLEDTRRVLQEGERSFRETGNEAALERVQTILKTLPPPRNHP